MTNAVAERTWAHLDAPTVVAHEPAMTALELLGAELRRVGYSSAPGPAGRDREPGAEPGAGPDEGLDEGPEDPLVALARGRTADRRAVEGRLGRHAVDALVDARAVDGDGDGDTVTARFTILGAGRVLAVLPRQDPDGGGLVYLGADSFWLLRRAWTLAAGGRRAVELGTGTGFVAAALAPRYELMLGTDVLPATVAAASMTFRLNPPSRGALAGAVADVGHGLAPRSFDLVVANAPWVPRALPAPDGTPRVFADGGPTGQELPARFIAEGAALLAPGGVAVTQCLDLRYDDGTRPLDALCASLREEGCAVHIEAVGPPEVSATLTGRFRRQGAPVTATLVDVVVERPGCGAVPADPTV